MFKIVLVDDRTDPVPGQLSGLSEIPPGCLTAFPAKARAILESTDDANLLAALLDLLTATAASQALPDQPGDSQIVHRVDAYIARHYQQKIGLKEIARAVHINDCYLSRLYHRETGLTITEAIARHRIDQACLLLADRNRLMKEIAIQVGLSDPAYFSVLFRRYKNLTPSEYQLHFGKSTG